MEASALSRIGLAGLAVMGQKLALNVPEKGFQISVYNRTTSKVDETLDRAHREDRPLHSSVIILVKAGSPVDQTITALSEKRVPVRRVCFISAWGSPGARKARHGPSLMPGGSFEAYNNIRDILQRVAAHVDDGPCITYIGEGGSGNFVKMVHNGIEYGDMQLISQAYDVLKHVGGVSNAELAEIFDEWNKGELESFLVQITADIFKVKDEYGEGELVDKILDKTGMKGTRKWTIQQAAELLVAALTIAASLDCRYLSGLKEERQEAAKVLKEAGLKDEVQNVGVHVDKKRLIDDVRQALYASKICSYAQGMNLIWKGGCIIRAIFLDRIKNAYQRNPNLASLVVDPEFAREMVQRQAAWRRVVGLAISAGISTPGMCASLSYFDTYRRARLPANLVQAQRDLFGAHAYERIDRPGSFHTEWTKLARQTGAGVGAFNSAAAFCYLFV
ncbi:6-phosphogluconate dehydrogenase decarboxylating 3 [Citrus sinensis]|uniref:6-phosphogluconate dehydrogenase decarboxylating 3 n=1 Tax=Citrus sinensis TaxID=2711 RepID=A0ACB8M9L7_CITSI|nr:6-phosphogluconate dehydrogenase decarboxylating 3 [Citrus sinensis]